MGLGVCFEREAAFVARATYIAKQEHEGWNGVLHGGITCTLMDEAFGWCLYAEGIPSVTTRMETAFLKPIMRGMQVMIRSWVTEHRSRVFLTRAEIRTTDEAQTLCAEATATMLRVATKP